MKLSIRQVLLIRQRDFRVLNEAFSVALGEQYSDPDYELTPEDAKKAALQIERIEEAASKDGGLFPLDQDQKWEAIKEANLAAEALRDLCYNFFGL